MSFPRYPEYRDSGVPWLGDIPAHWNVEPFKRQIDRNDGGVWGDEPDGVDDIIVLRSTEQTVDGNWRIDDPAKRKLSPAEIEGSLLLEGDLLVTKSSGSSLHIGKTTIVNYELAESRCCYSNFMQRIRMKSSFSSGLAWHLMNNDLVRTQFDLLSNSSTGLANLNSTMIGEIIVPVAPLDEQAEILKFLDQETAKIDALVAEQEKLMALLKEKRQAVITHAVTKGLDPTVPMKDSGVEWLGKVPAHWKVKRLRFVADIETGDADTANSTAGGEYPFFVRSQSVERIDRFTHDCEAVMTAGDGAGVGKVFHHFSGKFCAHQRVYIFRNFREVSGTYFFEYLRALFYRSVLEGTAKSTVDSLRRPMIAEFAIAIPPPSEMAIIENYLLKGILGFDDLVKEAGDFVSLAKERRGALIVSAVTGKIDVRGLAGVKAA